MNKARHGLSNLYMVTPAQRLLADTRAATLDQYASSKPAGRRPMYNPALKGMDMETLGALVEIVFRDATSNLGVQWLNEDIEAVVTSAGRPDFRNKKGETIELKGSHHRNLAVAALVDGKEQPLQADWYVAAKVSANLGSVAFTGAATHEFVASHSPRAGKRAGNTYRLVLADEMQPWWVAL